MTTLNIRTFEPGDGTRYRFIIQRGVDNIGSSVDVFSFGVGFDALITFDFPDDNDFIPYGYFAEKFGRFIKNEHTLYVGYLVFCRLTSRRAYHHEDNSAHGRNWNMSAWFELEDFALAALPS